MPRKRAGGGPHRAQPGARATVQLAGGRQRRGIDGGLQFALQRPAAAEVVDEAEPADENAKHRGEEDGDRTIVTTAKGRQRGEPAPAEGARRFHRSSPKVVVSTRSGATTAPRS